MSDKVVLLKSVYDEEELPKPGALVFLYKLMQQRLEEHDAHTNISHRQMPSFSAHAAYVEGHPNAAWYIPRNEAGTMLGSVHATKNNEIGIVIAKEYRRQGYAAAVLRAFFNQHTPLPAEKGKRSGHWIANIVPSNEASIRLFARFNATHIQNTYELNP